MHSTFWTSNYSMWSWIKMHFSKLNFLHISEFGEIGELVIKGKTKEILTLPEYKDGTYVLMRSTDQITCGDGARKNTLEGKGVYAILIPFHTINLS